MEEPVRLLVSLHLVVIGLSHVAQPRAWGRFFDRLRGWGAPGAFVNGFLTLTVGSVIVVFHDVWRGLPAALTVIGWLQVAKGLVCFVAPSLALRSMARVSEERSRPLVAAGLVLVALGVAFAWTVLGR